MKKLVCIAFLLLAAVLCLASCGKDENPQGLAFYLKDDGTYAVEIGEAKYLSKIEIPSTYKDKSVTEVGFFGYYGQQNTILKEIIIPNSVTTIGKQAFASCTFLTSVTIPDSVTTIGANAFRDCTALTSVTIGNNVTTIKDDAFSNCCSLTSIAIPNSVTSIGDKVFYGCSLLTSVIFENPNGWWYANSADATSGTSIPAAELADPATAAQRLRFFSYDFRYWHRD